MKPDDAPVERNDEESPAEAIAREERHLAELLEEASQTRARLTTLRAGASASDVVAAQAAVPQAVSDYGTIERVTRVPFYFATPHRAWERGTSENTNGLIRQYAPKGRNLARLTQDDCTRMAHHLNQRPRKRLGFRTPEECFNDG